MDRQQILNALLGAPTSQQGTVLSFAGQTVSVRMRNGVQTFLANGATYRVGDLVRVKGGAIVGRRRPRLPGNRYEV